MLHPYCIGQSYPEGRVALTALIWPTLKASVLSYGSGVHKKNELLFHENADFGSLQC